MAKVKKEIKAGKTRTLAQQASDKALVEEGKEFRWKEGQSGNPSGAPKAKFRFWSYVAEFSEVKESEFKAMADDDMCVSKRTAYIFTANLMEGRWQHAKETLDRDEGPIANKHEIGASELDFDGTLEQLKRLGVTVNNAMFSEVD